MGTPVPKFEKTPEELAEAVHIELTRLNAVLAEANNAGLKVELEVMHLTDTLGGERVQVTAQVFSRLGPKPPEQPVTYVIGDWARKKFERAGFRVKG